MAAEGIRGPPEQCLALGQLFRRRCARLVGQDVEHGLTVRDPVERVGRLESTSKPGRPRVARRHDDEQCGRRSWVGGRRHGGQRDGGCLLTSARRREVSGDLGRIVEEVGKGPVDGGSVDRPQAVTDDLPDERVTELDHRPGVEGEPRLDGLGVPRSGDVAQATGGRRQQAARPTATRSATAGGRGWR